MAMRAQNAWPSLGFDVKAANRLAGRLLSAGFYYKTFIRPQRLWPAYERVLERFAAGGVLADGDGGGHGYYDKRHAHPDVLVTGHPYVDVWQAVKPARVGLPAWPVIPPGRPWKEGASVSTDRQAAPPSA